MAQADMHGKVCLVTGSSSGLGKATAKRLAQLKATVILGCRDKERGESALAKIKAGRPLTPVPTPKTRRFSSVSGR